MNGTLLIVYDKPLRESLRRTLPEGVAVVGPMDGLTGQRFAVVVLVGRASADERDSEVWRAQHRRWSEDVILTCLVPGGQIFWNATTALLEPQDAAP